MNPIEQPTDIVRETIQAPHKFTDAEKLKISDELLQAMRNQDQIDSEFDSVKTEFKSRIEKAELEVKGFRRKLDAGFEMRPTVAVVQFNTPYSGRKQFVNETTGEPIRDEQMSAADYNLPLFRDQNGADATATTPELDLEDGVIPEGSDQTPGGSDAGTTPVGEALDQAAFGTDQPPLDIALDEPGWTVGGLIADVKTKAPKAGWPKAAVKAFVKVLTDIGDNLENVKATVRPHVITR